METAQVRLTLGVCSRPWKADEAAATQLNITHSELPTTEQPRRKTLSTEKTGPNIAHFTTHATLLHKQTHTEENARTRTQTQTDAAHQNSQSQPQTHEHTQTQENLCYFLNMVCTPPFDATTKEVEKAARPCSVHRVIRNAFFFRSRPLQA